MSRDRNARNAPQKAFRKVDSNKDGRITPDEFVEALRNMKVEVKLSREELNRLLPFLMMILIIRWIMRSSTIL